MHQPGWAFVEIVVVWLAIVATTAAFFRSSQIAGWLMVPYLAWVSFASLLNLEIWRLSVGAGGSVTPLIAAAIALVAVMCLAFWGVPLICFVVSLITLTRWYGHGVLFHRNPRTALWALGIGHLRASKPLLIRKKRESDNVEFDAWIETLPFGYLIVVDAGHSLSPYLVVHEVLHLLLKEERYPLPTLPEDVLTADERRHWLNGFGNVLHHPEIYRRMRDQFGLDMAPMWRHQQDQSVEMVQGFRLRDPAPGDRLTLILFTSFWQFVPDSETQAVNEVMEGAFPDEYQVCRSIGERARDEDLALYVSAEMPKVVAIIVEACLNYAQEEYLPPRYDAALRALEVVPMQEMPIDIFGD